MSPVNRAGSVSEISSRHSILRKKFDEFYEKPGGPGYRDLGFCDRDLGNRARNLSHMNTPARSIPRRNFFDKIASLSHHSDQDGIIFAVYVFPLQKHTNYLY